MSLLNRIKEQLNHARKQSPRDEALISLLTTFYGESAKVGKDAGNRETTDAEVVAVAKKFINGLEICQKSCNGDVLIISAAQKEISILNEYVPKQLTEEELKAKVTYFLGANPGSNMGQIMKHFKDNWSGQYDGAVLSKIAKESLN